MVRVFFVRPHPWGLGSICALLAALAPAASRAQSDAPIADAVLHRLVERADHAVRWIRDPYTRLDLRRGSSTQQAPRLVSDRSALLDAALARAAHEERMVLAYLPRIEGRPMYRAPVVDDYMRLAIWAEPELAALVNRRFVPLRIMADASVAARLGLGNSDPESATYLDALEPAVVFLRPDGSVAHRIDRIRTFSASWFAEQLRKVLRANADLAGPSLSLRVARAQLEATREPVRAGPVQGEAALHVAHFVAREELADGEPGAALRTLEAAGEQIAKLSKELDALRSALRADKPEGDAYPAWASRWRGAERQRARLAELALDADLLRARGLRAARRTRQALEVLDAISGERAARAFARGDFAVEKARCLLALGRPADARAALALTSAESSERAWLLGVAQWLLHERDEARASFASAVRSAEHPWTSRAAAMLARSEDTTPRAPLAHGFEMFVDAPRATLRGPAARSTTLRRDGEAAEALPTSARAAFEYLLAQQLPDGSWADARYAYWPSPAILPNVRVAVTALAATALLSWRSLDPARVDAALARAKTYLADDSRLALGTEEEVYSQAYRMLFWTRCLAEKWGEPDAPAANLSALVKRASAIQDKNSGFFAHEYKNAFCTGSMLWSLYLVAQAGVEVDEDMLRLGAAALRSARRADGSFAYGGSAAERDAKRPPAPSITRLKDASARMPVCEAILHAFGSSDDARLREAFATFLRYLDRLERVRKADFHSDGQLGGFFFWHAVFHASEAMRLCGEAQRADVRARLFELVTRIQEIDGSFIDSHELGKSYGTAMALLTLANLRAR